MYSPNHSSTAISSHDDSSTRTQKNTDSYDQSNPNQTSTPSTSISPTLSKHQRISTVATLDRQYHVFTQKLLLAANACKQPSKQLSDVEPKALEVLQAHKDMKMLLMKMETVVRGNEEEIKEIKLAAESSGSVGLKRKHRLVES
jgi:hypothetical protein